jgi:hypothetical protein
VGAQRQHVPSRVEKVVEQQQQTARAFAQPHLIEGVPEPCAFARSGGATVVKDLLVRRRGSGVKGEEQRYVEQVNVGTVGREQ